MASEPGWRAAAETAFVHAVSHPVTSRALGRLTDLPLGGRTLAPLVDAYCRALGVDLGEAVVPPDGFRTFNDFFTRPLRDGARPVAEGAGIMASPADSRLDMAGPVPADGVVPQVKGRDYTIGALLADEEAARTLAGGYFATLYLSPSDYHRVHCPVDGEIVGWRYVPGRLFPVNGMSLRRVDGVFARNERIIVHVQSETFGRVAVVFVGAANVGRISLAFSDLESNRRGAPEACVPNAPLPVRRGDELGRFNLGSTVVLVFERGDGVALCDGLERGCPVRMGQPLLARG